jgi:oxygen-dependent protoporphyrinogen oxidase
VYAGHASLLSARATVPQVVALLDRDPSLLRAATSPVPDGVPTADDVPVFAGLVGGVGRLPAALAASGRFEVRTGTTVRELRRVAPGGPDRPGGFELVVGSTRDAEVVPADRVVLATPAAPTARLLGDLAPAASAALAEIEYASMAVVTLAFRAGDLPELSGSGLLVPPVDGRRIKAATFSFSKWPWVRAAGRDEDVLLLRTSIGRHREERDIQVPDEELVAASLADLGAATGLRAQPVDVHVQRWGGGLPQYAVGHLDRVAGVRAAVGRVPGLAVCGAAYDGIGIPACIASARLAVEQVGH